MAKKKSKSKVPKDFVKKKKKVGKLAKSQDTEISIKTRKIVLPTQHSSKETQLVFKGKSLIELIVGTKHTNSNQRVSNLGHLLEMLSSHTELITPNVGSLLERIGVLLQDLEENVRASSLVLTKHILSNIKDDDLLPFLQIFIVQISSGMLHLDKGVQKITVQVLQALLLTHSSIVMKHVHCLINALVTLLTTSRAKKTIVMYLEIVLMILDSYTNLTVPKQHDSTTHYVKRRGVALYKHTKRKRNCRTTQIVEEGMIEKLVESCLPHIETTWLEDAPSQVYVSIDPSSLRTSILIVKLLKTFATSQLEFSTPSLIKLNNITKSVNGRFPFQCSISNRDMLLLWRLNMVISEYLMLVDKPQRVEQYFLQCFTYRTHELTRDQITSALRVVSELRKPGAALVDVIEQCCVAQSDTAQLFLVHFVKCHLHSLKTDSEIYLNLKENMTAAATHILKHFHNNRKQLVPHIFSLCLDREVIVSLKEVDQMRCLELCYHMSDHITPTSLSVIGQAVTGPVLDKFCSLLQALYQDRKLQTPDFISILVTQANKDDEEETADTDTATIVQFTDKLLANFDMLPGSVKQNLLSLTLPVVVTRLYSGLSRFSLYSYLLILLRFNSYVTEEEATDRHLNIDSDTSINNSNNPSSLPLDDKAIVKVGKIISSLIFNKESVSDWGRDIVILSVRLSFVIPTVFQYIMSNFTNKPADILSWYFSLILQTKTGQNLCVREKDLVSQMYEFLKDKIPAHVRYEYEYRLNLVYEK